MAAALHARVAHGGMLLLSGILTTEAEDVIRVYEKIGMALQTQVCRGEGDDAWCVVLFHHGDSCCASR